MKCNLCEKYRCENTLDQKTGRFIYQKDKYQTLILTPIQKCPVRWAINKGVIKSEAIKLIDLIDL